MELHGKGIIGMITKYNYPAIICCHSQLLPINFRFVLFLEVVKGSFVIQIQMYEGKQSKPVNAILNAK